MIWTFVTNKSNDNLRIISFLIRINAYLTTWREDYVIEFV